jgi:hypothetical protein
MPMTDEHTKADAAAKQTLEDRKKHAEESKKKLAEQNKAREEASKASTKEGAAVKPTPTQEENDLAMMGVHMDEHEADGSGPDPYQTKEVEAKKPVGTYPTRAVESSRTK